MDMGNTLALFFVVVIPPTYTFFTSIVVSPLSLVLSLCLPILLLWFFSESTELFTLLSFIHSFT